MELGTGTRRLHILRRACAEQKTSSVNLFLHTKGGRRKAGLDSNQKKTKFSLHSTFSVLACAVFLRHLPTRRASSGRRVLSRDPLCETRWWFFRTPLSLRPRVRCGSRKRAASPSRFCCWEEELEEVPAEALVPRCWKRVKIAPLKLRMSWKARRI